MKNQVTQSFMDGIAYFFGVGDNPIEKYYRELVQKRKEQNDMQKRKEQNGELSGFELDAQNLRRDWERVGMYLNNAIGKYEQEAANTNG